MPSMSGVSAGCATCLLAAGNLWMPKIDNISFFVSDCVYGNGEVESYNTHDGTSEVNSLLVENCFREAPTTEEPTTEEPTTEDPMTEEPTTYSEETTDGPQETTGGPGCGNSADRLMGSVGLILAVLAST